MKCKEASKLASQSLDRRLSWRERIGLRLHLAICDACRAFLRQSRFLREALRRVAGHPGWQLSAPARERIARELQKN